MLPLIALALLVSTFLVMAFLWYCQEGKKSEDREEHIYVIRVTKQQHELLKHAAEKKNVSGKKSSVNSKKNTEPTYPSIISKIVGSYDIEFISYDPTALPTPRQRKLPPGNFPTDALWKGWNYEPS